MRNTPQPTHKAKAANRRKKRLSTVRRLERERKANEH